MGKVVLDTSAWVAMERFGDKLKELRDDDELIMSPVALGELLVATRLTKRSSEAVNASIGFINGIMLFAEMAVVDDETSRFYAELKSAATLTGTARGTNDLWIAATAIQQDAELLSYDRRANFSEFPKLKIRS
jgi:predicted nucleic acid-binding protein